MGKKVMVASKYWDLGKIFHHRSFFSSNLHVLKKIFLGYPAEGTEK
jgi:hypothetical protein